MKSANTPPSTPQNNITTDSEIPSGEQSSQSQATRVGLSMTDRQGGIRRRMAIPGKLERISLEKTTLTGLIVLAPTWTDLSRPEVSFMRDRRLSSRARNVFGL